MGSGRSVEGVSRHRGATGGVLVVRAYGLLSLGYLFFCARFSEIEERFTSARDRSVREWRWLTAGVAGTILALTVPVKPYTGAGEIGAWLCVA